MIEEYSHNKDMEILNEYSLKKQSCKIYETNADWPKRKGQIYNYMEDIDTLLWNFARESLPIYKTGILLYIYIYIT